MDATHPMYDGAAIKYAKRGSKEFEKLRKEYMYMGALLRNFPVDTMEILEAFFILDPLNLPKTHHLLDGHGDSQLDLLLDQNSLLLDHFCPLLDVEDTKQEWETIPSHLDSHRSSSFAEAAEHTITRLPDVYPQPSQIYKLGLVMPVSSADFEHGFSQQNCLNYAVLDYVQVGGRTRTLTRPRRRRLDVH